MTHATQHQVARAVHDGVAKLRDAAEPALTSAAVQTFRPAAECSFENVTTAFASEMRVLVCERCRKREENGAQRGGTLAHSSFARPPGRT